MPGICPNCIQLVQEGERCPQCQGPLISVSHWSQNRQHFLADQGDMSQPVNDPNQFKLPFDPPIPPPQSQDEFNSEAFFRPGGQANTQSPPTSLEPPIRFYALKFLLGACAGAGAFVTLLVLVYSIKGG